jgi:hypothetical protein
MIEIAQQLDPRIYIQKSYHSKDENIHQKPNFRQS